MSNRNQIVRTQRTQRWKCTLCSQKPVADSQDNQMAPVLDMKSPGIRQYKIRILQWNANGIHRELQLLEDLIEATNVDVVCIQETKVQLKDKTREHRTIRAVRRDRPVLGEAMREGLMIYIRKHIPYKVSHPQANNSSAMEKLTIVIPAINIQTFTVSNWYLPSENSYCLQRTGISLSELQPDTKVHEVICAYVNAHDTARYQTANPINRGEYFVNAAMDVNSTFLNEPEQPTR